ncbi:hypothetical protein HDU86_007496 [Geranomyces michiganensis]|nr:hypothetical protein HDU86_007496 [Geranomyces michiganensis]
MRVCWSVVLAIACFARAAVATPLASSAAAKNRKVPLAKTVGEGFQVVGYFFDGGQVESIPFDKLSILNYAFAIPDANAQNIVPESGNWGVLEAVMEQAARHKNLQVVLSIGGWGGSTYFSKFAADARLRSAFVEQTASLVKRFNLAGVDIDWEFPGTLGDAGNTIDEARDTDNFVKLLAELRAKLPTKLLTAATPVTLWRKNGQILRDASAFASLLDYVYPMVYDVSGAWNPETSHDAPLSSFIAALDNWTSAGFKPHQVVLGLPFYGKTFAGVLSGQNGGLRQKYTGEVLSVPYKSLKDILASGGWTRRWDDNEKAAYWHNDAQKVFCTMPDDLFMRLRTQWALQKKAGGVMFWATDHDNGDLIRAISSVVADSNPVVPATKTSGDEEPTPVNPGGGGGWTRPGDEEPTPVNPGGGGGWTRPGDEEPTPVNPGGGGGWTRPGLAAAAASRTKAPKGLKPTGRVAPARATAPVAPAKSTARVAPAKPTARVRPAKPTARVAPAKPTARVAP